MFSFSNLTSYLKQNISSCLENVFIQQPHFLLKTKHPSCLFFLHLLCNLYRFKNSCFAFCILKNADPAKQLGRIVEARNNQQQSINVTWSLCEQKQKHFRHNFISKHLTIEKRHKMAVSDKTIKNVNFSLLLCFYAGSNPSSPFT